MWDGELKLHSHCHLFTKEDWMCIVYFSSYLESSAMALAVECRYLKTSAECNVRRGTRTFKNNARSVERNAISSELSQCRVSTHVNQISTSGNLLSSIHPSSLDNLLSPHLYDVVAVGASSGIYINTSLLLEEHRNIIPLPALPFPDSQY